MRFGIAWDCIASHFITSEQVQGVSPAICSPSFSLHYAFYIVASFKNIVYRAILLGSMPMASVHAP